MTPFTLTREQVRELDRRAAEEYGLPGLVLMENAGRGVAELLMRLNPERQPVTVFAGPGNNGGDGFVIARHLDNAGWPVRVLYSGNPRPTGDAGVNHAVAAKSGLIADTGFPTGWLVDALFGTGLSRPLGGHDSDTVEAINGMGLPVLAVDLPSGLDCDTGEPLGIAVRATHTATFVASKRGFLNPSASAHLGEVHVVDIGAPRKLVDDYRSTQSRGGA